MGYLPVTRPPVTLRAPLGAAVGFDRQSPAADSCASTPSGNPRGDSDKTSALLRQLEGLSWSRSHNPSPLPVAADRVRGRDSDAGPRHTRGGDDLEPASET